MPAAPGFLWLWGPRSPADRALACGRASGAVFRSAVSAGTYVQMVDTKIVVALIAVAGVVTQVVVTYLINRQSANDLRTNIAREIEIISKLRPGSDEVAVLESHVRKSINELMARDERRDRNSEIIRSAAPTQLVAWSAYGLYVWLRHGPPQILRPLVWGVFWPLVAVAVLLTLRVYWQLARSLYLAFGTGVLKIKTWFAKRRLAKMKRQLEELKPIAQAVAEHAREVEQIIDSQKDEIISEQGQAAWDEIMDRRARLSRLTTQLEENMAKTRELDASESHDS